MSFTIKIGDNEVENIISAEFNDTLNEINKAEINLEAQNTFEKGLANIGQQLTLITNNKTYKYEIINRVLIDNGSLKLVCMGIERIAVNVDIDIDNLTNATNKTKQAGIYTNVSASSILDDLVGHLNGWSVTTSINETISNFRLDESMSVWNGFLKLAKLQDYEIDINYLTKTFIVQSNLGNNRVGILNERIDFDGVPTFSEQEAKAKKVIVYGKGDGVYQVKATAQDSSYSVGDRTVKIDEPNYVSVSQCQKRADIELTRLKNNIKHYVIPNLREFNYNLSDTILVNSPSVDLENEELKIVRIILQISGNDFIYSIEVTNAEYSRAQKSATQELNEQKLLNREKNLTNQGSGNTLTFGAQNNCNSAIPLKCFFNLPSSFIRDEANNIRVEGFTVDYDLDNYVSGAGGVSVNGDIDIDGTTDNDDPSVVGTVALDQVAQSISSGYIGSNSTSNVNLNSSFQELERVTISGNHIFIVYQFEIDFSATDLDSIVEIAVGINSTTKRNFHYIHNPSTSQSYVISGLVAYSPNSNGDSLRCYARLRKGVSTTTVTYTSVGYNGILKEHSHAAGSLLDTDLHGHGSNGIEVDGNDLENRINISDSIGENSNLNASSVGIKLYYNNGTSWVLKHTISSTGNTIQKDVDISNNGQFPDNHGLWRVDIIPNSTSADYGQCLVKLKHNLDNI